MTGRPRMSAANEPPCVSEEPRRSGRIDRDGFIAPSQISHAVSFGMFLVHPCRDVAGCARTVGAAICALHAFNRDAAAMSIAEEKAAGFRKQRRIGRLGHADTQEEDQGGCDGRS